MQSNIPLLSVCLITYNHVNYIAQAIEGVLMQKVDFPWELIIADDFSTDGTRGIILDFHKKYPDFIKLIFQKENVGPFKNWIELITAPNAKYIAYLEGDDYWTDPLKLQKQVNFLETHPEYSAAAHQALVMFDNESGKESSLFREHAITDIETRHLLDGRLFHTGSLIFRSEIIRRHSLPMDITSGDRALFFLIASFGKIYYSNEVMCCYRKHTGGISSWVTTEMLEKDLKIVPWISKINPEFPRHYYYRFLHLVALSYPYSLSMLNVIKHSFLYLYHSLFVLPINFQDIKVFATQYIPLFLRKIR